MRNGLLQKSGYILPALAVIFLDACGGGSGGSDNNTDTIPPSVTDVTPLNGAAAVAPGTTVTATFDEDIFAASVDSSSFTLAADSSVSGTVSFDGAGNIATFTPDSVLPGGHLIAKGDVAPLVSGVPAPDGKITTGDVVVILRKAVGLVSW